MYCVVRAGKAAGEQARAEGGSAPRPRADATLLAQRRCARSSTCSPSRRARARRDAPQRAALLGADQARPGPPTRSLAGTTDARHRHAEVVLAKPWVGVRWRDLCGAEERRVARVARRREATRRPHTV